MNLCVVRCQSLAVVLGLKGGMCRITSGSCSWYEACVSAAWLVAMTGSPVGLWLLRKGHAVGRAISSPRCCCYPFSDSATFRDQGKVLVFPEAAAAFKEFLVCARIETHFNFVPGS